VADTIAIGVGGSGEIRGVVVLLPDVAERISVEIECGRSGNNAGEEERQNQLRTGSLLHGAREGCGSSAIMTAPAWRGYEGCELSSPGVVQAACAWP